MCAHVCIMCVLKRAPSFPQDAASYHEDVKVFKKFHGSIIGKGGANLKKVSVIAKGRR